MRLSFLTAKSVRALAATLALAGLPPALATAIETPDTWVARATTAMQRSRLTADAADYTRAQAALDQALALDPAHYGALRTQAWVYLGRHEFQRAVWAAKRAQRLQPRDWFNYAHLTDAYVELGDYERAERTADRLMRLRPGVPAYTRVAFLRSLHGDRDGAIALLELAVETAGTHDREGLAWTLVHLGAEQLAAGQRDAASVSLERALSLLPGYYLAEAGLARVRTAQGRLAEAITLYEHATASVPAPELVAALGDAYAATGDARRAADADALVDAMAQLGSSYGRQLVLYWADHDRQLPRALALARAEARTRHDVFTVDALAWALYKNGRPAEAARIVHRADRLGTDEARLHYHAGMIAAACGRPRVAARHLRRALALDPSFDLHQAPIARAALAAVTEEASG